MSLRRFLYPFAFGGLLSCAPASGGGATAPVVTPAPNDAASAAPGGVGAAESSPAGAVAPGPEAILERPELAAYHGWVRYLMFRAAHAEERFGKGSERARQDEAELSSWTQRILENPDLLAGLRGVVEWAYLSPVDGSGQPFKLNIPIDYDPARPAPLSLYMHGYSGNHLEHSSFMKDRPGNFEVAVLGRSRGGRYRALSEADVLGVLDYIQAHWAIDPDRVHLMGGSMGGGGTFWMGSRYPQRFASGRPVCGYASDLPIGNLLTFPLYATHSDDDFTVPVLHSRGPMARLRELGGQATLDETTGLGHAAWDYKAGNERGDAWYVRQVRPASNAVKQLTFTALDGEARRDYWAEIAEWGQKPEPASMALRVTGKNQISARLDNVTRLTLRVSEAPLDPKAALTLNIAGVPLVRPAPLPAVLTIVKQNGGFAFEEQAPALPFRLHTPGGANQLYNGEPLLIVYGTSRGTDATLALRAAAGIASRSASAAWPSPNGEVGDDGISHNQNLYGELRIKADVDVSADEIATHHLVLIGTAEQNALVARLAERLPVRYDQRELRFTDGTQEAAADTAIGLVHYNPLAPSRLIFWVASNDLAAYRADALVPRLLGTFPTGIDFAATRVSTPTLVMARSFDSRWNWVSREGSATLPPADADAPHFASMLAEAVRRASKADFALALHTGPNGPSYATYAPSVRLMDLTALFYYEPIGVMTLTGAELATARLALAAKPEIRLQPEPGAHLDPKRNYRVAVTARQISPLVAATHLAPRRYTLTELDLASALGRSGFVAP
jgi:hypothetical protein